MSSTEHGGLGPCVQDPAWVRMSSPTFQKRKKKQEPKPQSHINKCLNEKRRREQENTHFEELAELIQASFVADMNSLSAKPDKCVILQQTVDKLNQIRESEEAEVSKEAVQQGEITSSRQTLLQNKLVCPLVLEALDGFLFLVSTEDKIELVSENVHQYINYTPDDLVGKVIYNIIHVGDHTKFSSSFLSVGWSKRPNESTRSRSFTCRFLVKPPDDQEETMEERQQRVSHFEQMQICAVLHSNYPGDRSDSEENSESVNQQYLLCIARRIPANEPQGNSIEQFTTKLDVRGNILDIDTSGVSSAYSQHLTKDLVNQNFGDFCHSGDLNNFTSLLKDTNLSGLSTSKVYKLKFGSSFIHIQSKFKQFQHPQEEPFIMATHTIISSFQDGSGSSSTNAAATNSLLEETLGTALSQVSEEEIRQPKSIESKLRMPSQSSEGTTDINRNMEEMTGLESSRHSQNNQPNKILKSLLNQDDPEDTSLPGPLSAFGKSLSKIRKTPSPSQQQANHVNHFLESNNSAPSANNMLRTLLNETPPDSDESKIKKERDDQILYDILNDSKDDKFSIKQESSAQGASPSFFMSKSPPATPVSSTGNVLSMPSPSSTFSYAPNASPLGFNKPSDMTDPEHQGLGMKGLKRPCESPHDGNPQKQQVVGAFEGLLATSPPTSNRSPASMSMAGPNTPLASPNTPSSRSNTPITKPGSNMPGHMSQQIRPSTPYGMSHQQMNMGHMSDETMGHHVAQNNMNLHNNQYMHKMHSEDSSSNNKLLRELLSSQSSKSLPPLNEMPSPYALPSEKLPKDICEKLPRVSTASSSVSHPAASSHSSDILTNLLKQPITVRSSVKNNSGVPGSFQHSSQHVSNFFTGEQRLHQQSGMHPGMHRQNSQPINNMDNMDSLPNLLATTEPSRTTPNSSIPNSTPTSLPPFVPPPGIAPLNVVPSTSYADGQLPSIITSGTSSFFSQVTNWEPDDESAIEAILAMETDSCALGDYQGSVNQNYAENEKKAIQQIKARLMALDNNSTNNSLPAGASNFTGGSQGMGNVGQYPPPYNQRRFGNQQIPQGMNKGVPSNMQHLPSRNMPQSHQRMGSLASGPEAMRQRIQRHPNQGLLPSSSSDGPQSAGAFNQSFDDLLSSPGNVNIIQRNHADSQSSPNYNMMNSPHGNAGGDQVPSGQRIPQAPFSPLSQIPSPLSNTQQFQNTSNMSQMGVYQNAANSQQSPRLSQGSPDPPNYAGGGNMMPQISPTGQVSPSPQNPAWTPGNQQQRQNLQQNPMLSPQINMMSGGQRGYTSVSRSPTIMPSLRSLPNSATRQNYPPGHQPSPNETFAGGGGPQNQQIIYSNQQNQPYRLQRTMSTPVALQGVHARSAHYSLHHHSPSNAPSHFIAGQFAPHAQNSMMNLMGPMDANPQMMTNPMMSGVGGMIGAFGESYDVGSNNCFPNTETASNSSVSQGHTTGNALSNQTRRQLLARVNPDGNGPSSPAMGQPQAIHQRVTQAQNRPQSNHNPSNYTPTLEHSRSMDGTLQSMNANEGNTWAREPLSGPSQSQPGAMVSSPRVDDARTTNTSSENDRSSLLKTLLISNNSNPMI